MNRMNATYIRLAEWHRGQTMTEYALIVSAIAVAVLVGYQSMGTDLRTMLAALDSQL